MPLAINFFRLRCKPRKLCRTSVWAIRGGGLLLITCITCIFLSHTKGFSERDSDDFLQWKKCLGGSRSSLARFTGHPIYAPYKPRTIERAQPDIQIAARNIYRATRARHSLEGIEAISPILVTARAYGKAIQELERGIAQHPQDAKLLNNLAAAYLARYEGDKQSFDLVLALDASDRAIQVEPWMPEPIFNRSLALHFLHLEREAAKSWLRYLEVERDPSWLPEARLHLQQVMQPKDVTLWAVERNKLYRAKVTDHSAGIEKIVQLFPQAIRLYAEDNLLPSWAIELEEGDYAGAARTLSLIRDIGFLLSAFNSDNMIMDSVRAIDRVSKLSDKTQLMSLAKGHHLYKIGREAFQNSSPETAGRIFSRSSRALEFGGSPFWLWASFYRAAALSDQFKREQALLCLNSLMAQVVHLKYQNLEGRIHWLAGMVLFGKSEPTKSLSEFDRSLAIFDSLHYSEDAGAIHYLIAGNLVYLGNSSKAWEHLYESLCLTDRSVQERRIFTAYDEAGSALAKRGESRVALYFRNEVVSIASLDKEPAGLAHAYLRRAEVCLQLNRSDCARADLGQALRYAESISSKSFRQRSLAGIFLTEAEADILQDSKRALLLLEKVRDFYSTKRVRFELPRVYLARYEAYRHLGEMTKAVSDLDMGIKEYESIRTKVADDENRISYFDQADQLFDTMIGIQAANGAKKKAFEYAERERARALLDLRAGFRRNAGNESFQGLKSSIASPRLPEEIRRKMRKGVCLIEFSLLKHDIVVWILRSDQEEMISVPVHYENFTDIVETLSAKLARGENDREMLATLYDILLRPLEPWIRSGDTIVFVPDKILYKLAFSALIDRRTGKYLIEDHAIIIAPSASIYIDDTRQARPLSHPDKEALLLGITRFQGGEQGEGILPDLGSSDSEVLAISRIYGKSLVLLNEEATKHELLLHAGEYPILHLATHVDVNDEYPMLSRLLLARDVQGDTSLFARDLYKADLKKTSLVVLAGCETARGKTRGLEGVLSLVRPFLAKGVRSVVASLWKINDVRAGKLFYEFHKNFYELNNAATALRKAQLSFIVAREESLRNPSAWAGVQVFGN